LDGFRYVVGVLAALSLPPSIAYWLVIHPFVGFWRRLGPKPAFAIIWAGFVAGIYGCWLIRGALLGRDLGTNGWLIAPGLLLYLAAARVSREATRHLNLRMLIGLPEVATANRPGKLLSQGIYARIRHPRYAAYLLGALGLALIVNYSGLYLMAILLFPALHLVAVIEERELRHRFGDAWVAYSAAVPRLIPRLARRD